MLAESDAGPPNRNLDHPIRGLGGRLGAWEVLISADFFIGTVVGLPLKRPSKKAVQHAIRFLICISRRSASQRTQEG